MAFPIVSRLFTTEEDEPAGHLGRGESECGSPTAETPPKNLLTAKAMQERIGACLPSQLPRVGALIDGNDSHAASSQWR